jgi:hypothetical protein
MHTLDRGIMNPAQIIGMVVCTILFLGSLFLTAFSLTLGPHWGMFVCCLALSALLSLFVIHDVRTLVLYFKNKNGSV